MEELFMTRCLRQSLPLVLAGCVWLFAPAAARGQSTLCNANLTPVAGGLGSLNTAQQINNNFETLVRTLSCLQRELQLSQANLRTMETNFRTAMQEVGLLKQQLDTTSPSRRPPREITLRACESSGGSIVYLPSDIVCSILGPTFESQRAELPAFQVLAP
jgi:hypothetical protein